MTNNLPSTEMLERIHFDTLLAAAEDSLATFAANTWTDRHDHDPGMTLLQAFAYGISDAAYRHILPLRDLLTPKEIEADGGLFSADFGPHQALTSGPITPDDYRRAMLDLHTSDNEGAGNLFYFRDVRLTKEPVESRYTYWYDSETRKFSFHPVVPETAAKKKRGQKNAVQAGPKSAEIGVRGGYVLWVEVGRNMTREKAEPVLDEFLKNNRNLCEQVREVIWVAPNDINLLIDIELQDDCRTPANVMAQVYTLVENFLRPQPVRQTAKEMAEQGMNADEIYEGPKLVHGWIAQLPPQLDYAEGGTLNLTPLTNLLMDVSGVKSIRRLAFETNGSWEMALPKKTYPRPWGANPLAMLGEQDYTKQKVRLFKRGQQLMATTAEITEALPRQTLIVENPVMMPYGRWRNTDFYRSAGARLPECYQLEHIEPDEAQIRLRQFLLPFEQQLTNVNHLLSTLPSLLSFDKRQPLDAANNDGPPVWGGQWPFPKDTMVEDAANATHAEYREALEALVQSQRIDQAKELDIISFLLSYFGVARSPHTLLDVRDIDYLKVQRGYLSQISELAYDRASIRIDRVSSFQKRIAARLGFAPQLFDGSQDGVTNLPFYLVEHRALLPAMPDAKYNTAQSVTDARLDDEEDPTALVLALNTDVNLVIGYLIDLEITTEDNSVETIGGVMIGSVNGNEITLRFVDNERLGREANQKRLLDAQKAGKLHWKNANVWLDDIHNPLIYAEDQKDDQGVALPAARKRLSRFAFPIGLEVGSRIVILDASSVLAMKEGRPRAEGDGVGAKVISTDIFNGLLVAEIDEGDTWPEPDAPDEQVRHYWYQEMPPSDRFSFQIGVVVNRDLLYMLAEPEVMAAWVEQIIREEMPCHVTSHIHWMAVEEFNDFAKIYARWQNEGRPLGDDSYRLMYLLGIGERPHLDRGINVMRIATEEQKLIAVGPNEEKWDEAYIEREELFNVPPPFKAGTGSEEDKE